MNRSKILNSARIAVSAICLLLCAICTVLWVRSYWQWDRVVWGFTPERGFVVYSVKGAATVDYSDFTGHQISVFEWDVQSNPLSDDQPIPIGGVNGTFAGFLFGRTGAGFILCIPYWFLVPLFAVLAVVPWIKRPIRFSLRTILVATTLIALALGAAVIAAR